VITDPELDRLSQRIESAKAAGSRAQANFDRAKSDLLDLQKRFATEFKVANLKEADALLSELESRISTLLAQVEAGLGEVENAV